jgi:hypothetical protein
MAEQAQQRLAGSGFGNFKTFETSIGSRPAVVLEFDRPQNGGTWSCREYFVAGGTLAYTVGFGTSNKAAMFDLFDRMAKTFEFEAPEPIREVASITPGPTEPAFGINPSEIKSPAKRNAFLVKLAIVVFLLCLLAFLVEARRFRGNSAQTKPADSPWVLKKLPTDQVIQAGLTEPQVPWAWQEIQSRVKNGTFNTNETEKLMVGLTAWLGRDHPNGYNEPLYWLGDLLETLNANHWISESNALVFSKALHGNPTCQAPPRIREGERTLELSCSLRDPWNDQLFGFKMLNHVQGVRLDGHSVEFKDLFGQNWNQQQDSLDLKLPLLAPGRHTLNCDVLTAFVPESDLIGLDPNAPPADWPTAKIRWVRTSPAKLM